MFAFATRAAVGYAVVTRWYPSNIAIAWLRTRRGLKWAWPAMLVLTPGYFALATYLAWLVREGAPGWVGIFALVALVSAVKFLVFAPVSLALLAKAKLAERRVARA